MTVTELTTRTRQRLDVAAATPGYWTDAEILTALNEAQRLWALLTLSLEARGTLALTPENFYRLLTPFPSFLIPLRVRNSSTGAKLVSTHTGG